MAEHRIISISVEKKLLEKIESGRKQQGFSDRSEFWRKAALQYLSASGRENLKGRVRGALIALHDAKKDEAVHDVQHARIVTTHLHNHFKDKGECLEVFIVEGEGKEVQEIVDGLRRAKSVKYAQFVRA